MGKNRDNQALKAMLAEDLGSEEEAGQMLPLVGSLREVTIGTVSEERRRQILAAARREFRERRRKPISEWLPLLILRSQVGVVQREIWLASALMFALGLAVTLVMYRPTGSLAPLILGAPVIAAAGIAFLYNSEIEAALEIERALPVPLPAIVLARLTLVLGFDTLLGLGASIVVAAIYPDVSLWPLVIGWFAPMAFLAALAFFVSTASQDSGAGVAISMSLWLLYTLTRFSRSGVFTITLEFVPASLTLWLVAASVVLIGASMVMVGRSRPLLGR
jgi:hypothetical protein